MDKQKKPSAVCDDLVTDSSILQGRGHYALLLNAKDVIISKNRDLRHIMSDFFRDTLHIAADGQLHVNEFILAAIVVVAAILLIAVARDVARSVKNKMPGRKSTIFSHRKNRYKDRINRKKKFLNTIRRPTFLFFQHERIFGD